MPRARWALAMTGWVDEARARSIMGPPPEPSVSGSGGGRRRSAMSELSPQGEARDMELVSTMSRLAPSATVPKPCDCTESPDRARWPRLGFLLRSGLSHLLPGAPRFSVTLRLFATPGFPPTPGRPGPGRGPPLGSAHPLRSIRAAHDGSALLLELLPGIDPLGHGVGHPVAPRRQDHQQNRQGGEHPLRRCGQGDAAVQPARQ